MPSERRLHPLSVLFAILGNARSLILPGLLVLVAARGSNLDVWVMLLAIPYALVAVLRYLSFRYELGNDDLVIRTGIVFRNVRHIPYARIHNIGSVETILHRLCDVVEARVETAGGGGKNAEARLQVLSRQAMDELRRSVAEKKRSPAAQAEAMRAVPPVPSAGPAIEAAPGRVLLRLPVEELIVHGIIENRGMVVMAAVWGFFWQFSVQSGWYGAPVLDDSRIRPLVNAFEQAGPPAAMLMGAGLIVVFMISLRIFSIGWALVKLYGFTLTRNDGDLTATCGLFTRVSTAIPARRIQVLTVREGPLHRLLGRVEVRADIVGGSAEEASAAHERLAPLLMADRTGTLLSEVQPGLDLSQVPWQGVHPGAAARIFKKLALVVALASVVLAITLGWTMLALIPLSLPLLRMIARGRARWLGWWVDDRGVFFRSGWLWRRTSAARHDKIQSVGLRESPFDRRRGMATLQIDNAGLSAGSHRIRIPYLDAATARRLHEAIGVRAAQSAFRW